MSRNLTVALMPCFILMVAGACGAADTPSGLRARGMTPSADRFSTAEWSEPVLLGAEVNSASRELRPALSPDGLSLYFGSDRPNGHGGLDLWVAIRACVECPWEAAVNVGATLNTAFNEGSPAFSTDGRFLFFTSNKPGGSGNDDIYVAYRADGNDNAGWEAPTNLGPDVNTGQLEFGSGFQQNQSGTYAALYFTRGDAVASGIYVVDLERAGNSVSTRGPAALVQELSAPGFMNNSPTLRGDGKELLFWSTRPGGLGGPADLWVSTRQTPHDAWSVPTNLGMPVNSVFADLEPSVSHDGRTLVFSAGARRGGLGGQDIWYSTRLGGQR